MIIFYILFYFLTIRSPYRFYMFFLIFLSNWSSLLIVNFNFFVFCFSTIYKCKLFCKYSYNSPPTSIVTCVIFRNEVKKFSCFFIIIKLSKICFCTFQFFFNISTFIENNSRIMKMIMYNYIFFNKFCFAILTYSTW